VEVTAREPVLVDLALQGGGSHGAFTWGVLDRLIEEPWLRVEAISGTSAGAMNAALVADGWTQGTANEILNRLNAVSFNSPLMKELRMMALLRQVADPGHGEGARWAGMRTHGGENSNASIAKRRRQWNGR
jgi:predicted acylesterase/phospholipase RssA